ncbi:MAG: winged helix DNA-binding domain-containing protein [Actinomycetota bacterium]
MGPSPLPRPIRSIDDRERRTRLVARHLLDPAQRRDRSIEDVAAALGPLHSTDPVTPYLSLHARADTSIDAIDRALYDERTLARFTTIRRTVFAMDVDVASSAWGAQHERLLRTLRSQLLRWLDRSDDVVGDPAAFLAAVGDAVVDELRRAGPLTGAQLSAAVPALATRIDPQPGAAYSRPIRITSKVLEILGIELRIVRGRPSGADLASGSWRWEVPTPGSAESVVAADSPDAETALRRLLHRHLRSYGPTTATDMAWWTGLPITAVRSALADLDVAAVTLDGIDEPGLLLAEDIDPVDPPTSTVALLPGLDSTTMGWKQRAWYVDDRPATGIFDRNGNAGPTIWLDGRVVGVWSQRNDGSIGVELHEPVDPGVSAVIATEADRITQWLGEIRVAWRYPTAATKRLATD